MIDQFTTVCALAGLALTATLAPARQATGPPDPGALQEALETVRDSMEVRGVSAAVIQPDGTVWTGQAGESFPDASIEPETLFDAGSVGKMFTAAVVLQLAGEGAVDLDAPIDRWLPDAPHAERVTPRMLLTHTSGWADVWDDPSFLPRLVSAPAKRWTPAEILAATPPPVAEPGARWEYSSSGYAALGAIAEAATGEPFGTLVRERVIDPLGLERTVHGAYEEPALPVAHGWLDIDDDGTPEDFTALLPATAWRTSAGPAGAILTTAADLARFTRAFLTGELHGEAMARRIAEERVARPDGNRHGLGFLEIEIAGKKLAGHRGNSAGYSAAAWHAPEAGITVAVLTNKHGVLVTPFVEALLMAATGPGGAGAPAAGGPSG